MPRPKKSRRICGTIPEYNRFGPKGRRNSKSITMTLDEYEATIFESIDEARIFRDECEAHFKHSLTIFTMECCFIEQYCDTLGWSAGMTLLQQEQHIDNLATI